MIKALDNWLFDRVFQPAVNQFPDASPVECGRFFLMGAIFVAFFGIGTNASVPNAALWLMGVGACSYLYFATGRMKSRRGRNPMRIAPMSCPVRVFVVLAVVHNIVSCAVTSMSVGSLVGFAFNVTMALFLYVGACDSPPPRSEARFANRSQFAFSRL